MSETPVPATIPVVAALIESQGRILLTQRPPGTWMEGYWEFPGGKLNPGEDPRAALKRELVEELGIEAEVGRIEEVIIHSYPDRNVLLMFYWCRILEGVPTGLEGQALKWVQPEELVAEEILPADQPLVAILRQRA